MARWEVQKQRFCRALKYDARPHEKPLCDCVSYKLN